MYVYIYIYTYIWTCTHEHAQDIRVMASMQRMRIAMLGGSVATASRLPAPSQTHLCTQTHAPMQKTNMRPQI